LIRLWQKQDHITLPLGLNKSKMLSQRRIFTGTKTVAQLTARLRSIKILKTNGKKQLTFSPRQHGVSRQRKSEMLYLGLESRFSDPLS